MNGQGVLRLGALQLAYCWVNCPSQAAGRTRHKPPVEAAGRSGAVSECCFHAVHIPALVAGLSFGITAQSPPLLARAMKAAERTRARAGGAESAS